MHENEHFKDVVRFHVKFGLTFLPGARLLNDEELKFRDSFHTEELNEIRQARRAQNFPEYADGLIDLVYVLFGTAYFMGFDWRAQPMHAHVEAVQRGFYFWPDPIGFCDSHDDMTYRSRLAFAIDSFYHSHHMKELVACELHLAAAVHSCYMLAINARLPWDSLWNEVHRANMAKVRATTPTQRGGCLDVVKPAGWTPPAIGLRLKEAGWQG